MRCDAWKFFLVWASRVVIGEFVVRLSVNLRPKGRDDSCGEACLGAPAVPVIWSEAFKARLHHFLSGFLGTNGFKMARKRKEKDDIKLKHPDRSAPSEKTLLDIAQERNLFEQADWKQRSNAAKTDRVSGVADEEMNMSPELERILNTVLWAFCLSTLHFTLDVLVQHQYGMAVDWSDIFLRTGMAVLGILHPIYHRERSLN